MAINFNDYNFKEMNCNSFIDLLLTLNETELSILGCIIGFYISSLSTINQQNSLGNFFELIGQILLTMNAQAINLNKNNMLNEKIHNLEKEIYELKKKLP